MNITHAATEAMVTNKAGKIVKVSANVKSSDLLNGHMMCMCPEGYIGRYCQKRKFFVNKNSSIH